MKSAENNILFRHSPHQKHPPQVPTQSTDSETNVLPCEESPQRTAEEALVCLLSWLSTRKGGGSRAPSQELTPCSETLSSVCYAHETCLQPPAEYKLSTLHPSLLNGTQLVNFGELCKSWASVITLKRSSINPPGPNQEDSRSDTTVCIRNPGASS